jgi:hypothetical protein
MNFPVLAGHKENSQATDGHVEPDEELVQTRRGW